MAAKDLTELVGQTLTVQGFDRYQHTLDIIFTNGWTLSVETSPSPWVDNYDAYDLEVTLDDGN